MKHIPSIAFEEMSGSAKGKISGLNLFQRLNFWVVKLGDTIMTTPPTLSGVETPSTATIVCTDTAFIFKLDQALADNGGIYGPGSGSQTSIRSKNATTAVGMTPVVFLYTARNFHKNIQTLPIIYKIR